MARLLKGITILIRLGHKMDSMTLSGSRLAISSVYSASSVTKKDLHVGNIWFWMPRYYCLRILLGQESGFCPSVPVFSPSSVVSGLEITN